MRTRTALLLTIAAAVAALAGDPSAGARPHVAAAAPTHTETWAYDDSFGGSQCNGGLGASRSLVRGWVTYAETNCGANDHRALNDCHGGSGAYCTVIQYLDANLIWPLNPLVKLHAPAQEDWWLHQPGYTDSGHRLRKAASGDGYGVGYYLNGGKPAVQQWFQNYLRTQYDAWDGVEMDDTHSSTSAQFWGSGYSSSEEIATDAGVQAEHEQMASALTHSNGTPFLQIDNNIDINVDVLPMFPLLNNPGSVVGLMSEGEPWDQGMRAQYPRLLDYMAYVDSLPRDFIVLQSYDQRGALAGRRVQEATVLLGYSPGHVVDWADLERDNWHLSVWPEEGIYPTQPLESMSPPGGGACLARAGVECRLGGHHTLETRSGVYRREFAACYDRGVLFGRCAVIVNDTSHAVRVARSWLRQSYSHQITMRGGDVQSGGSIDLTGAGFRAGSTRIGAHDALLLAG